MHVVKPVAVSLCNCWCCAQEFLSQKGKMIFRDSWVPKELEHREFENTFASTVLA